VPAVCDQDPDPHLFGSIRMRIKVKSWIRIETNADPQHWCHSKRKRGNVEGKLFLPMLAEGKAFLQGVTKRYRRYRLSWLTNSALVYDPKCGG
jgi:hypothetical protein